MRQFFLYKNKAAGNSKNGGAKMSTGVIILIATGILIYFGAAQRVLDHLYLSDSAALLIIVAMLVGSFYNIPLSREPLVNLNIGGGLIPIILIGYIFYKNDTIKETINALMASILAGGSIYAVTLIFQNFGEGRDLIDPLYIFAIIGGLSGYIFGRSRRGAFIAGTLGFMFYNLINVWRLFTGQLVTQLNIGGAGIFGSTVISGFFALLLAELIGESREHLPGGNQGRNKDD